jgi:DNA-binding GntR family transcriptional regulator
VEQGDVAYAALRSDITEWRLAPGTALGEIELAQRLGMSRTPVREALKRLAREGLVRTDIGRSAVVAPLSVDEVINLYQAREALEIYVLRLAAHGLDRAEFAELAQRYEQAAARAEVVPHEIYVLSERFDRAVDAAAASPYVVGRLDELRGHLHRLRRLSRRRPERLRESATQHALMSRAILAGDEATTARIGTQRVHDSLRTILDILANSVLGVLEDVPPPLTTHSLRKQR